MSGHRRVKDLDYDEDELEYSEEEGEEGQDELSPEDQVQMSEGTIKVRTALGDDFDVTDRAIHEALWHYYYDVAKSVSYLKNQRTPQQQQPKKQKQESKFDQAASSAAQTPVSAKKGGFGSSPFREHGERFVPEVWVDNRKRSRDGRTSAADWFKDVPWFNLPPTMSGQLIMCPVRPPLRLLGGSAPPAGKTSKLAALAAARKKKEAEQKAGQSADASSGALSLLDRLGVRTTQDGQGQTTTREPESTATPKHISKAYPVRKRKSPSPPPATITEPPKTSPSTDPDPPQQKQNLRTEPSIFAETMCGGDPHSKIPISQTSNFSQNILTTLFGQTLDQANANPFAGPSPDDIVTQAQAKAGSKNKHVASNGQKQVNGVANGVSALNLEESAPTPKIKSKNLDVLAEHQKASRKNEASFVVIGHVDHGKSTLMGRLLYDLKVVDQRSVERFRKEATNMGKSSFALAWVMDSTAEERERGVTVDIATNHFETEKTKFTILDAPGHRDFIPNMIAGASQADFAVLVIDAGTNSFEAGLKGQTKEHALLVRSMGVQRVVVAVNKMDSTAWSEDRFIEIKQQMTAFLTTAGFQIRNVAFIPCAGLTGENIVSAAPKEATWYKDTSKYDGETLVQALEAYEPAKASITQPLRLSISDVFRGGVTNPLSISGKIDAGNVQIGDTILAMPAGETASIRGIEIDNESVEWAVAGQIVTLHLSDIDPVHLRVGDIVCDPQKPIANIKAFTTKILAFEHILPMQVDVHRGRLHVPGRITQMIGVLDKASGEVTKKKPRVIQPGSVARVRVELDSAVPLEVPGRVVLRASGATVAAGLLEQVHQ